jgi:hypothetical protein
MIASIFFIGALAWDFAKIALREAGAGLIITCQAESPRQKAGFCHPKTTGVIFAWPIRGDGLWMCCVSHKAALNETGTDL